MVGHAGHAIPLEVVGTMIEMADVAWNALEHRREWKIATAEEAEAERLRSENLRLRSLLADNHALLQDLSQTPAVSEDCPPDLFKRLEAAVDTSSFLTKLEKLQQESTMISNGSFQISQGTDLDDVDILVHVDNGEPSQWVLIPHDMAPDSLEEVSGIDKENYVIISEENVVDGIANFIARCILENPKSKVLTPEDLQKAVTKTLGAIKGRSKLSKVFEAGKIIYALSTWGIALAGLYRHRAIVKVAARGVHASTKLVLKAL